MEIKKFKKYIISGKKYIIGFILGLSLIGGLTYAADSGSIGALFEKYTYRVPFSDTSYTKWVLDGSNIKPLSIIGSKITNYTIHGVKLMTGTISEDKLSDDIKTKLNSSIDGKDISVNNIDVKGKIRNSTIKEFSYQDSGERIITDNYPLEISDSLLVNNNIFTNNLISRRGLIRIRSNLIVYGGIRSNGLNPEEVGFFYEVTPSDGSRVNYMQNIYSVDTIDSLCGDDDGCLLILSMKNYDNTGRYASLESRMFFNKSTGQFRVSHNYGETQGKNGDNINTNILNARDCHFTDYTIVNGSLKDNDLNFGLYNTYGDYHKDTCYLIIKD